MLLNRETAAETVRLLSEGFDLPVRVYLSLWHEPVASAYSKRLCKHFVNDVEMLKKAAPYNDGCILFYWTPYGECSVLLCGNAQQYVVLGPVTLDSNTGGEDFPLWDLEGFQTIHNLLPVSYACVPVFCSLIPALWKHCISTAVRGTILCTLPKFSRSIRSWNTETGWRCTRKQGTMCG